MRQLPPVAFLDHPADAPVVLSGVPGRLTGHVQLRNPSAQRVVLREARLCKAPVAARAARGEPAAEVELAVPLTAILAPEQRQRVRVRIAIDPHTPPGRYDAELCVGEHRHPVQLHVAETVSLGVAPDVVVVENRPGGRIRRRLVLANHGNVPLEIGNIGAVVLDEDLLACKTIRAMLREGDERARTIDDWISAYLREGKRQLDAIGMLWVEVDGAPHTLEPGETRAVEIAVRVPDSLDPRSRYRGVAFLVDADIAFTVAPTGTIKRDDDVRAAASAPAASAPDDHAAEPAAKKTGSKKK